jgi:hypothetical protein
MMRTHKITVRPIGDGFYRVTGACSIASTARPIADAAALLVELGADGSDRLTADMPEMLLMQPMPLRRLVSPPVGNPSRTPSRWGPGAPEGKVDARSAQLAAARWR